MIRWTMIAVAAATLAGCNQQAAQDSAQPDVYSVRLGVTPAPGAPLQRVGLPAVALAALTAPDRSDVRIFDATGAALPIAATLAPAGTAELRSTTLEALPILGTGGALRTRGAEVVVEEFGGARVVRMTETKAGEAEPAVLGVLLDTRTIADPVRSLRLNALWPAQQPVRFTVESSADLQDWTPLGGRVLYRKSADIGGAIGAEDIDLGEADLHRRYLRIRWTSPSKLLGPVRIEGATLIVAHRIGGDRPAIMIATPRRTHAHELRFGFGHPVAPAGLRISPAAGEMLVPVRIFGRNAPDQDWISIGAGVVRAGGMEPVALDGPPFSDYRIEADRRTAGFAAPPRIALSFEPMELLALFSGRPPYTLAAGARGAENRFLAIEELVPGDRLGKVEALPTASVQLPAAAPILALAKGDDDRFSQRKALLWGLLLLGVTALALMVWKLWKPGK
ncbi:DUF3999 family protein [Rhizorhabdus sp.]|jgi:hypothetical protein|uniref:DUF3999 family protein n=1 Tax=Rhizorhabdus sp. TaxID=1968843 RepID=UPI001B752116|nr:DUF3999 family protein [Rhizorhabdus sp.]MBP8234968.1 DUF3999 family protein [Rhizorhabdus sp.]